MNTRDRAILLAGGVLLLLVLLVGPFLLMTTMCPGCITAPGPMGGMMGGAGSMMGGMSLMLAARALILVGLIALLVWSLMRLGRPADGPREESPLVALQQRYARGDIGREEYERIREDLLRDRAA